MFMIFFKMIFIATSIGLTLYSAKNLLVSRKHLLKFPKSFRTEYIKESKIVNILNLLSIVFISVSFIFITSHLFYFVSLISIIFGTTANNILGDIFADFEKYKYLEDTPKDSLNDF